jgi:hypothetical protein
MRPAYLISRNQVAAYAADFCLEQRITTTILVLEERLALRDLRGAGARVAQL